jgi:Response regulator containing CheY-like receiver, AAA-type ATPase, and DNA-binding domains
MSQTTRKRRVVLAEDNDEMRKVIHELIEGLGLEVSEVSSGADLVRVLSEDKPVDLLVTDVRMPWLSGLEVSLSMRRVDLNIPILVVSAFGDDHLREQVEKLGNATFLDKPFKAEEFLSIVSKLLLSYTTVKT